MTQKKLLRLKFRKRKSYLGVIRELAPSKTYYHQNLNHHPEIWAKNREMRAKSTIRIKDCRNSFSIINKFIRSGKKWKALISKSSSPSNITWTFLNSKRSCNQVLNPWNVSLLMKFMRKTLLLANIRNLMIRSSLRLRTSLFLSNPETATISTRRNIQVYRLTVWNLSGTYLRKSTTSRIWKIIISSFS